MPLVLGGDRRCNFRPGLDVKTALTLAAFPAAALALAASLACWATVATDGSDPAARWVGTEVALPGSRTMKEAEIDSLLLLSASLTKFSGSTTTATRA